MLLAAAVLLTQMVRNDHNGERAEYVAKIKALEHLVMITQKHC